MESLLQLEPYPDEVLLGVDQSEDDFTLGLSDVAERSHHFGLLVSFHQFEALSHPVEGVGVS